MAHVLNWVGALGSPSICRMPLLVRVGDESTGLRVAGWPTTGCPRNCVVTLRLMFVLRFPDTYI